MKIRYKQINIRKREISLRPVLLVLIASFVFRSVSITSAAETINGAGATFPYPLYAAWAFDYHRKVGPKVNYQSIGSGGGQRQIISRTVDFGASDAPMKAEDISKSNLLQFPAVIGGVVPVVNIKGIKKGELKLEQETTCGLFMGTIKFWDDPKIKYLNPELELPHSDVNVVHRSDGSGTTAIFTKYLSAVCSEWKEKVGSGNAVNWPVGIGGKGNEGVANYVKRIRGSIGYIEFAYAVQNKLVYTKLKNKAGNFVEPADENFKIAAASAEFTPEKNFYVWLIDTPGDTAWPISGATFILLAKEKVEENRKVAAFYDWCYKNGDAIAGRLFYVPLPDELKEKVRNYWQANGIY